MESTFFFETGSHFAAPIGLEPPLYSRLVSNSEICLLLLPGIKCKHHYAWQNLLLKGSRLNTTLGSFLQPSPEEVRLVHCVPVPQPHVQMVVIHLFVGNVQEVHCHPQWLESEWSKEHRGLGPGATICSHQCCLRDTANLHTWKCWVGVFSKAENRQFPQEPAERFNLHLLQGGEERVVFYSGVGAVILHFHGAWPRNIDRVS